MWYCGVRYRRFYGRAHYIVFILRTCTHTYTNTRTCTLSSYVYSHVKVTRVWVYKVEIERITTNHTRFLIKFTKQEFIISPVLQRRGWRRIKSERIYIYIFIYVYTPGESTYRIRTELPSAVVRPGGVDGRLGVAGCKDEFPRGDPESWAYIYKCVRTRARGAVYCNDDDYDEHDGGAGGQDRSSVWGNVDGWTDSVCFGRIALCTVILRHCGSGGGGI